MPWYINKTLFDVAFKIIYNGLQISQIFQQFSKTSFFTKSKQSNKIPDFHQMVYKLFSVVYSHLTDNS